jgi:serine/threonine protein kinase
VEKVAGYQKGGFCPISIGQILDDKYKIIGKLGHGGYSTVWLAKDVSERYEFPSHFDLMCAY